MILRSMDQKLKLVTASSLEAVQKHSDECEHTRRIILFRIYKDQSASSSKFLKSNTVCILSA